MPKANKVIHYEIFLRSDLKFHNYDTVDPYILKRIKITDLFQVLNPISRLQYQAPNECSENQGVHLKYESTEL